MKAPGGKIACVDQYNERNQSKTLENKSPLYIFGKSHFLYLAKASPSEGIFVNDLNFASLLAAWFGAQTKTSFGTQSIISSTRKTSIRTLFSTGRASVLVVTWVSVWLRQTHCPLSLLTPLAPQNNPVRVLYSGNLP